MDRRFTACGLILPTIILLCLFAGLAHAAPITVKDDAGKALTLQAPAQRVISLAPSLTEMLYEAGGGDKLVGAVEYSDFPPQALKVPRIGSNQKLDLERIATLKPDLVLVWFHGNAQREVERLTALNIPMAYFEPHGIGDIPGVLERIGQLMGSERVASAAATKFRARHATLQKENAGRAPVRVFYQIAQKPLLTVNDQQIISDVIRLCGGVNVFGKEPMLVPHLSTESVVATNPDVILTARMGGHSDGPQRAMDEASLAGWLKFGTLTAVKNRQLWLIPGDTISRHGPRILDGTQAICAALDDARKAK
ncbi:cobalamin-binding protein [Uliginosibacterium aquaticum]|uniref:Cobalamin-binding protein n=1 Tax=Uliginosibacterium aquaticum TaxID=2731212 RepID=A0ABX2IHX0_9RHOO|nr:cobalamin-binding protein [Uliginosibacterium aquaticum]NSL56087.1 cobalamin-binding protein [Uliginosibacterium aquaticum]